MKRRMRGNYHVRCGVGKTWRLPQSLTYHYKGADVFIFDGVGKDVIIDFGADDTLQIGDGKLVKK